MKEKPKPKSKSSSTSRESTVNLKFSRPNFSWPSWLSVEKDVLYKFCFCWSIAILFVILLFFMSCEAQQQI